MSCSVFVDTSLVYCLSKDSELETCQDLPKIACSITSTHFRDAQLFVDDLGPPTKSIQVSASTICHVFCTQERFVSLVHLCHSEDIPKKQILSTISKLEKIHKNTQCSNNSTQMFISFYHCFFHFPTPRFHLKGLPQA